MLYYFKRNYDIILILSGYTRCDSQQVYADQNQTGHKTLGSDEGDPPATTTSQVISKNFRTNQGSTNGPNSILPVSVPRFGLIYSLK